VSRSKAARTEGERELQERELKLQGPNGIGGMLAVLREAFQDDDAACSAAAFHTVMLFSRAEQVRAARDIWKFRIVDKLATALRPAGLTDEGVVRLKGAVERQASLLQAAVPFASPYPAFASPLPSYRKGAATDEHQGA